MELVILIALGFACKSAWDHVRTKVGESRAASMKQVAKTYRKGEVPKHKLKAAARRHDLGWWAGEIGHGFPVARTGLHAGYLAHRTAAVQHQARREEAKTTHADVQASFLGELPEHKRRQAEAKARRDAILAELAGAPVAEKGKGSRKAVREAADEVARKRAEKQQAGAWPPPLPADAVKAEPGPYAPSRRVDGKPETEADRRFFDHRESGYLGPLTRDGEKPDMNDPQQRADAETLAGMAARGEAEPGADAARNPSDPVFATDPGDPRSPDYVEQPDEDALAEDSQPDPSSTKGDTVPTGTASAETTYEQQLAGADAIIRESEAELARLRARRIGQMVEHLATLGLDSGTLGRAADIDSALAAQEKAAQQAMEGAQALRDGLVRDHGAGQEYHATAPGGGAERDFFAS